MTGIYDCFGYGAGYDVPFEERYRLIRSAGFDSVMLWWSDRFGRGAGYEKDADLLALYGHRLKALHLHDNGGSRGQHRLPFDGGIDWPAVMKKLRQTGCQYEERRKNKE